MKKQANEIDKILHQGKIQDCIDILESEEEPIEDCFLIYINKDKSIQIEGTVALLSAFGMLEMAKSILHDVAWNDE